MHKKASRNYYGNKTRLIQMDQPAVLNGDLLDSEI